jgi:hypothetical protein
LKSSSRSNFEPIIPEGSSPQGLLPSFLTSDEKKVGKSDKLSDICRNFAADYQKKC